MLLPISAKQQCVILDNTTLVKIGALHNKCTVFKYTNRNMQFGTQHSFLLLYSAWLTTLCYQIYRPRSAQRGPGTFAIYASVSDGHENDNFVDLKLAMTLRHTMHLFVLK